MAKYYYPNGDLIKDLENFVDFYSKMYFYWQDLAQEVRIMEILSSGLEMENDKPKLDQIKEIMEWKTGRKADKDNCIITRSGKINLGSIVNRFPQEITPKAFLNIDVAGVGPVYGITLLFFASNGAYPIYDRFANISLNAIFEGKKPHSDKWYPKDLSAKVYEKYIADLKDLVKGTEILYTGKDEDSRKLDRALWVYGHMFHQ